MPLISGVRAVQLLTLKPHAGCKGFIGGFQALTEMLLFHITPSEATIGWGLQQQGPQPP